MTTESLLLEQPDGQIPGAPLQSAITYEKIPTHIYADAKAASRAVAHEIAALIRQKQDEGKPCVLGLATGSSPKTVYAELVRMHREEGLSFQHVVTFNLDEYYPMEPTSLQSYWRFMREQLFDLVDIPDGNYHVPEGNIPPDQVSQYAKRYDAEIEAAGGLDFQLLGIGGNGHIGFNEPGSLVNSHTRLMMLDNSTRAAASADFGGLPKTPAQSHYDGRIEYPDRPARGAAGVGRAQSPRYPECRGGAGYGVESGLVPANAPQCAVCD